MMQLLQGEKIKHTAVFGLYRAGLIISVKIITRDGCSCELERIVRLPAECSPNCRNQAFARRGFQYITQGADLTRLFDQRLILVHGYQNNPHTGPPPKKLARRRDAIQLGQANVCNHHVGVMPLSRGQKSTPVANDRRYLEFDLQNASQLLGHVSMILRQNQPRPRHFNPSLTGNRCVPRMMPDTPGFAAAENYGE
jgi:hypothetical protein